jgi:tellurium resistance protein TerD
MSNPIVLNMTKAEGSAKVTLNMSKISLSTLKKLKIEVFWSESPIHAKSLTEGYDLDLSAFFLDAQSKVTYPDDVLYFNSAKNANGAASVYDGAGVLPADERSGGSEEIHFDYSKVPSNRNHIDHYVTIFEGRERSQTFVMMADAKVVLTNMETGAEVQTFTLQGFTNDTALHIGSSLRNAQGGWEFQPAGTARNLNLPEILALYQ